ncbi:hypothetical protein SAMN06273570_5077 [Candidatus Pantoea floridensis]|uniref:Uncharacterized protein n=1 Tax=Candidatus Pantoea floridensis TaxID=1938870 RepID=A0A286DRX5_9GAMM|nr:hypothetical protein BX596_4967 [Enterobacteriaceae bacterium JKS000233]SOD61304.1 hypothetical protein SAMN06273570_5077 [Pantoea floridensis]
MKRRTRINYTSEQKAIIRADINKVIPCMTSPECSTDITLLIGPSSIKLRDSAPPPENGTGCLFRLTKGKIYPEDW